MYTAEDARRGNSSDLDERIKYAVEHYASGKSTYMRVYADDWFAHTIEEELHARGFKNINVPSIMIKGDVYFEWD